MLTSSVIFDFGGTLIRETGMYPEEAHRFLLSRAVVPHCLLEEDLRDFDETVFRDMLERRERSGLDFELTQYLNLLQNCFSVRFRGNPDEIAFQCWVHQYRPQLEDGAVECLRQLRASAARIALLSNTVLPLGTIRLLLKEFGILDFFDAVACSSEIAYRKPHNLSFRAILGLLHAVPGESAMVGDSLEIDVAGAAAVGITTVWYNPSGLTQSPIKPDYVVSDLRSVPQVLGFS
jgi:HAD superfamily hydrolase (TIGR01509 family)